MHAFWRHPALPVGIVLLVLGLGNWIVSRGKLIEYEHRLTTPEAPEQSGSLKGYSRLTQHTNATLLARLHRSMDDYGVTEARHDFYTIVHSGGRLIAIIGFLLIGGSLLQRWRERLLRRDTSLPPIGS